MVMGMVGSNMIEAGLAVGADTAQGRPGDALEYSAGSGGAAFVLGPESSAIAKIEDTFSFTTDTPDFWRRQHADYPSHGGRFTGPPAYFKHILGATNGLLEKTGRKLDEFDYFVFHQPNAKFPLAAAAKLGIPKEKLSTGLLTPVVGNTYSGASMLGLSAVLDEAKPGNRILVTSFGSGAGSDSFDILVTDKIEEVRDRAPKTRHYIDHKRYIDYSTYIKYRRKLKA
jgi:hydroxymethylglutaryl-CoA synthase